MTGAKTINPTRSDPDPKFRVSAKRVALVAVDRSESDGRKFKKGFWPHFADVADVAASHGCDMIFYSPHSHCTGRSKKKKRPSRGDLFGSSTKIKTVVLEVDGLTEIWSRGHATPHRVGQIFYKTAESKASKLAFIGNLRARALGSTMVVICGESNIVQTKFKPRDYVGKRFDYLNKDEFGFLDKLDEHGIRLILNPVHNYMIPAAMKRKREILSRGGRTVLTVWNRGEKRPTWNEPDPWYACFDGKTVLDRLKEVSFPHSDDIRIAVFDVTKS